MLPFTLSITDDGEGAVAVVMAPSSYVRGADRLFLEAVWPHGYVGGKAGKHC